MPSNRKLLPRRYLGYLCFALLAAAWLQFSGLSTFQQLRQARHEERELDQQLQRLREENTDLEQEIGELEEDGARVEGIARQRLGLAREGEIVILIPEKE